MNPPTSFPEARDNREAERIVRNEDDPMLSKMEAAITKSCAETVGVSHRNVRFEMEGMKIKTEVVQTNLLLSPSDYSVLWWTSHELNAIKKSCCQIAQFIKDSDKLFYDAENRATYMQTLSKTLEAANESKDISANLKRDLAYWTTVGHSRRGLEKFVSEEFRQDRERRRLKALAAVLFVQKRSAEKIIDAEERAQLASRALEHFSHVSKMLARTLGEADAIAVQVESVLAQQECNKSSTRMPRASSTSSLEYLPDKLDESVHHVPLPVQ
jgi:hypothetical protein